MADEAVVKEKEQEENKPSVKGVIKTIIHVGTWVGSGAIIGCLLKKADLSSMKGIAKLCTGLGITGLSVAAAKTASKAMDEEVDDIANFIEEVNAPEEEETPEEVEPVVEQAT